MLRDTAHRNKVSPSLESRSFLLMTFRTNCRAYTFINVAFMKVPVAIHAAYASCRMSALKPLRRSPRGSAIELMTGNTSLCISGFELVRQTNLN